VRIVSRVAIGARVVTEPGATTPEEYARRVRWLAVLYPAIAALSIAGELLLFLRTRTLVTLAQRSNVETLTLLFFSVFFAYVGWLGGRGVPGAARILRHGLVARRRGREEAERRKHAELGPPRGEPPRVALGVALEREGRPGEPFELAVGDAAGRLGAVRVEGARVEHRAERRDGSNNLLAFFAAQVEELAGARQGRSVEVVEWARVDSEGTEQFLGLVDFARNLSAALERPRLWPTVVLGDADVAELERRLAAICPALRDEAWLPDWEYTAEHKLPIVPEPLGLASLGISARRADPLASISALAVVVVAAVTVLAGVIAWPPWVPGK
jgi:hypothetical protein